MSILNGSEIKKLSEDDLENVSGGIVFDAHDIVGGDEDFDHVWQVLDDKTGRVLQRCSTRDDARQWARDNNQNRMEITWDQVCQLRND